MKTPLTAIIITVLLVLNTLSQNITNTIGTNGEFKIKDGTTDYLTLSQVSGNLFLYRNMELGGIATSTSNRGVITKNGIRFIHNYGTSNTFLGENSGNFTMTGYNNTIIGFNAFLNNTTGFNNSAIGSESLFSNTTGYSNSAFGHNSLVKNTQGSANSSFGNGTLYWNTIGDENSAFGEGSLFYNSTGNHNSAFGVGSLFYNSTGNHNSAFGVSALFLNSTGWHNTAVGYDALRNNVSGWQNTAVGHHSLQNNTGNYNTAIGYNSGSTVTTGSNLTLIGIDANPTSPTAVDQITLGNQFVSSLRCNVTTITSLSDRRDKSNINELSLGLDFIAKLKPRQFNWDKREWYENGVSDGSKMKELPTAGFIAQELDSAQTEAGAEWLNLVLKDNPEKWEATPGNLLPVMVKAIQELNEKFELLKAENLSLKSENDNLKNKLTGIEQNQFILLEEIKQINEQMLNQVQHNDNTEIKITEK